MKVDKKRIGLTQLNKNRLYAHFVIQTFIMSTYMIEKRKQLAKLDDYEN